MLTPCCPEPDMAIIDKAVDMLTSGGVVAFPTETGYGLGAAIFVANREFNLSGLEKIYRIKHRPFHKPLLVLIHSKKMLNRLSRGGLNSLGLRLASRFWPGPLTLLLEAASGLPMPLCGYTGRIGVRISSHPWANALVRAANTPITATSANLSGRNMAMSPEEVAEQLHSPAPDMILDGGRLKDSGLPSTIVDCAVLPPLLVREGMVASDLLKEYGIVCRR